MDWLQIVYRTISVQLDHEKLKLCVAFIDWKMANASQLPATLHFSYCRIHFTWAPAHWLWRVKKQLIWLDMACRPFCLCFSSCGLWIVLFLGWNVNFEWYGLVSNLQISSIHFFICFANSVSVCLPACLPAGEWQCALMYSHNEIHI